VTTSEWSEFAEVINDLYASVNRLQSLFPGRKFTLDGHLVGSIGEVLAAFMFDLELETASNKGFDARAKTGRPVEIKFTQGKSVAMRERPEHLLVLQKPPSGKLRLAYNGPG